MIISKNKRLDQDEFEEILQRTIDELNTEAQERPEYFKNRSGIKLEKDVLEYLNKNSSTTSFEDTFEIISGQKFPDIIAKEYYGVEVKTTKSNSWTSTGSSIVESTRVDDIEKIYLLFGKLSNPIEFKVKAYEDCLSDIVVTHSPRYKINMDLDDGETIFDKLEIGYDELRNNENSIGIVKDYYRKYLKEGEKLWWIDSEPVEEQAVTPYVKLWSTLKREEKKELQIKGFCWFPEIFSSKPTKFNRLALWLVSHHAVVANSLRDLYTAGGRVDLTINEITWENQPQIFYKLSTVKKEIIDEINNASEDWLIEFWGETPRDETRRIHKWIELVLSYIESDKMETRKLLYKIFAL